MIEVRLKGINKVKKTLANGTVKTFYYHRPTNTRLEGEPGSPEFLAAFQAAEKAMKQRDRFPGQLKSLIHRYVESSDFRDKAPRTRKDYLGLIKRIEDKFGEAPLSALNDPRIRSDFLDWRDQIAGRSAKQADYTMTMLGIILSWSVDRGLLSANHAYRPGKVYKVDRAGKIWTEDIIQSFLDVASPEMGFAMVMAKDTGQRQGDLLALTWAAYDGKTIKLTQSKTKAEVSIPVTIDLQREFAKTKDRISKSGIHSRTILARPDGQPWKTDHFRHEWRRTSIAAGIDGLTFNDLRGTAVTALADAGCTIPEISAITGHSPKSAEVILSRYLARTKAQGQAAIHKLENHRRTNSANRAANQSKTGGRHDS